MTDLDQGESEAIILSDLCQADLLLMDELKGRQVAGQMGLHLMGTVGMLRLAYEEKLLSYEDSMKCIEALQTNGRHISEKLKEVLENKKGFEKTYDEIWGMKDGKLQRKDGIAELGDIDKKKIWDMDSCFRYGEDLCHWKDGKIVKLLEKAEEVMEKAEIKKIILDENGNIDIHRPLANTFCCCRVMVFRKMKNEEGE